MWQRQARFPDSVAAMAQVAMGLLLGKQSALASPDLSLAFVWVLWASMASDWEPPASLASALVSGQTGPH